MSVKYFYLSLMHYVVKLAEKLAFFWEKGQNHAHITEFLHQTDFCLIEVTHKVCICRFIYKYK